MQEDHLHMLKILQPMSEFGGLWNHQKYPSCTKSVTGLFEPYTEEEKESIQSKVVHPLTAVTTDVIAKSLIFFGPYYLTS